jgi:endonuclease YncB( thermonuclease family)
MKKVFNLAGFFLLIPLILPELLYAAGESSYQTHEKPDISECDFQHVRRVIDGDTFETPDMNRVRLIGVDTPETTDPRKPVQWFGRESSRKLREWIEGKTVCLKTDIDKTSNTDRYGRLLRYVWKYPADKVSQEGKAFFVNAELVQQGYAFAYTRFPFQYLEDFSQFERDARKNNRGLWNKEKQEKWEREYDKNRKLAETCEKDNTICSKDAIKHIGRFRTVRFFVEKSHDSGNAVFLNSNVNHKDPDNFTAVIFEKVRKRFPPFPADFYWGKTVDVSGRIEKYKGRAEIILTNSKQVVIVK